MRQIEMAMCAAVEARFNWHCSNTEVKVESGIVKVYLHGNLIYKKQAGVASFEGITVFGGAFAHDMSGQWYYC